MLVIIKNYFDNQSTTTLYKSIYINLFISNKHHKRCFIIATRMMLCFSCYHFSILVDRFKLRFRTSRCPKEIPREFNKTVKLSTDGKLLSTYNTTNKIHT